MENNNTDADAEIAAITQINNALKSITDADVLNRILHWANLRYGSKSLKPPASVAPLNDRTTSYIPHQSLPLEGIAQLDDNGAFHITVRDLKAKTQNDAAIRLSLITVYTYKKLTGEDISSRQVLVPVLKHHRLYDGNTRVTLSRYKGLIRQGDSRDILILDAYAQKEAEQYIKDVQDESLTGSWTPKSHKYSKKKDKPQSAE